MYMCTTGLLCCTVETNTTLYINYIPIKKIETNKLNITKWYKKLALDMFAAIRLFYGV